MGFCDPISSQLRNRRGHRIGAAVQRHEREFAWLFWHPNFYFPLPAGVHRWIILLSIRSLALWSFIFGDSDHDRSFLLADGHAGGPGIDH